MDTTESEGMVSGEDGIVCERTHNPMELMLGRADVVTVSSGMRRKDVAVVLVARSEGIYPHWSRILCSNIRSEMKFRNGHKKRRKRSTRRTEIE